MTITMRKVGGEEEEIAIKGYRSPVQSLENQSTHTITAVGVPYLSNDMTNVKVKSIERGFGLHRGKIRRKNGLSIFW